MALYVRRDIEPALREMVAQFPAVALTGPRQSGKSTLLHHLFPHYTHLTLDDPLLRRQALEDPELLLDSAVVLTGCQVLAFLCPTQPGSRSRPSDQREFQRAGIEEEGLVLGIDLVGERGGIRAEAVSGAAFDFGGRLRGW